MKIRLSIAAVAVLAFQTAVWNARAADESAKTNARAGALSPEERRARMEELRERNPEAFRKLREELERRREELKKLPPAEREAKIKELRERFAERRKVMSMDERKAKRQEIKGRLEKQLSALREKKTNGTLTTQETRRLERLETVAKRFQQPEGGEAAK